MNHKPNRILVFRIGQIGDTVAALPSLWVLRQYFPDASIVILSEIPAKKTHLPPETVLPQSGLVDGFEKYPGGASLKHFFVSWRKIRQLRRQGFDTLVYLVPSGRTQKQRVRDQLFFRICGINRLLAFKGFTENLCPRLSDGSLSPLPKEADALLHRLKLDDLPVPPSGQGCMDLQITEAEREKIRNWWKQNGNPETPHGWMAICTGGKASSQLWPWERYAEVVRLLTNQHGIFPVIIGGMEDREVGKKLLDFWKIGLCAAGVLSVRESAALMKDARFYLGNDTGIMHLASAVGIPCIAVFSARNWPGIWEPYGTGHRVLRFDVPCSGCKLEVCDKDLQCLKGIQVEQVYVACVGVIEKQKAEKLKREIISFFT
jgi:lipopolysaccharide heptosyltransferase III